MEPFDFDKLIRDKVIDEGNIHSIESNSARQGIWMDIQDHAKKKNHFISWYHLAASIALLIVGFSIILNRVQKHYVNESQTLLVKIESLEKDFKERASSLVEKDKQIQVLSTNMNDLENTLAEISDQRKVDPVTKVVYKTDTIFLKTIEYVRYIPENSIEGQEIDEAETSPDIPQNKDEITASLNTDNNIYPSRKLKAPTDESEKVRFKFGNYIAREN